MRHILAGSLILSSILCPVAAKAGTSSADASTPAAAVRVSTGVVAPTLIDSVNLVIPQGLPADMISGAASVGLTLTVDEKGQPTNIQVVKPLNPYLDARVVDAIRKSHYRPATIDNQPTAIDLNLTVNIAR